MKRRSFNHWLIASLAMSPLAGVAAPRAAGSEEVMPYLTVGPIESDSDTVRLFFSYACSFCRASHEALVGWGKSLPTPFQFRETPVIGDPSSLTAAIAFYAVRKIAPGKLGSYNRLIYEGVQQKGRALTDMKLYAEAVHRVGIDLKHFGEAAASVEIKNIATAAANLPKAYRISSTPSVAAGGRYVITPEVTRGVNENFMMLANGVISKVIHERGGA